MKKGRRKLPVGAAIAIGFLLTILLGFLLLLLPFSQKNEVAALDCLFISTSAVCVTGLSPIDISKDLTLFGQNVVMFLIQVGGLGFAVVVVFLLQTMSRTRFFSKTLVRESLGFKNSVSLNRILKYTLLSTFVIELLGASVFFTRFIRLFPFSEAVHKSIFHAVSAFNNAGFDLFSTSLTRFSDDPVVLINAAVLIIMGGLGYIVYYDALMYKRRRCLTLHTKIVLLMTSVLLVAGTILFKLTGNGSFLVSFFHSASSRTAGFFASDFATAGDAMAFLTIILMFIGASPGSTGGGIKTTTFFTICLSTTKIFNGKRPEIFNRRVSRESILKSFGLLSLALFVVTTGTFVLTITEGHNFLPLLFETVSAYATVGLSMGVTTGLSAAGKVVIVLIMYIGRVGAITLVSAIRPPADNIDRPEENIQIG